MEIVYYKDPVGNFGDDLNEIMWPAILPKDVLEAPDHVLFGIGSIFSQPQAIKINLLNKKVFVLGSGAGYAPLPRTYGDWSILAVRGPLTARLISQPNTAVTDAAALLATAPHLIPRNADQPDVIFMPHHQTTWGANWDKAASMANMIYVDPQWPTDRILRHFSRARLVVTEAMHGAIIADTMRIPWIPVGISRELLPFKWNDWCLSMGLAFKPTWLPPSSAWEKLRHTNMIRQAKIKGLPLADTSALWDNADKFISDFHQRYPSVETDTKAYVAKNPSRPRQLVRSALSSVTWPFLEAAASSLQKVVTGPTFMSTDAVFSQRVDELISARDFLVEKVRTPSVKRK